MMETVDYFKRTNDIEFFFSNKEVQSLRYLLSWLESQSSIVGSLNFVKLDNAFLANLNKSCWVIDSRVNKYMSGSSNKLSTYSLYLGKEKVYII